MCKVRYYKGPKDELVATVHFNRITDAFDNARMVCDSEGWTADVFDDDGILQGTVKPSKKRK